MVDETEDGGGTDSGRGRRPRGAEVEAEAEDDGMKGRAPLVTVCWSAVVVVVMMDAIEGEGFTLKERGGLVVSPPFTR